MRNEVFKARWAEDRKNLMNSRLSILDAMCSTTTDEVILAGLGRLRKQLHLKWGSPWAGKKDSDKKSMAKAQEVTKNVALKRYSAWSAEDELVVANLERRDEEIALVLGRTIWAVRSKRKKMRKLGNLKPNAGNKRCEASD